MPITVHGNPFDVRNPNSQFDDFLAAFLPGAVAGQGFKLRGERGKREQAAFEFEKTQAERKVAQEEADRTAFPEAVSDPLGTLQAAPDSGWGGMTAENLHAGPGTSPPAGAAAPQDFAAQLHADVERTKAVMGKMSLKGQALLLEEKQKRWKDAVMQHGREKFKARLQDVMSQGGLMHHQLDGSLAEDPGIMEAAKGLSAMADDPNVHPDELNQALSQLVGSLSKSEAEFTHRQTKSAVMQQAIDEKATTGADTRQLREVQSLYRRGMLDEEQANQQFQDAAEGRVRVLVGGKEVAVSPEDAAHLKAVEAGAQELLRARVEAEKARAQSYRVPRGTTGTGMVRPADRIEARKEAIQELMQGGTAKPTSEEIKAKTDEILGERQAAPATPRSENRGPIDLTGRGKSFAEQRQGPPAILDKIKPDDKAKILQLLRAGRVKEAGELYDRLTK